MKKLKAHRWTIVVFIFLKVPGQKNYDASWVRSIKDPCVTAKTAKDTCLLHLDCFSVLFCSRLTEKITYNAGAGSRQALYGIRFSLQSAPVRQLRQEERPTDDKFTTTTVAAIVFVSLPREEVRRLRG